MAGALALAERLARDLHRMSSDISDSGRFFDWLFGWLKVFFIDS